MGEALVALLLFGVMVLASDIFLMTGHDDELDMAEAREFDRWDAERRAEARRRLNRLERDLERLATDLSDAGGRVEP